MDKEFSMRGIENNMAATAVVLRGRTIL